ncbi:MAG: DUF6600 domain-containing protein [Bryobacteraceae bacterium]
MSFQPAGVEDWVPASPNRPITTGDQIWVDEGARAEMHVGSTALRLGEETSLQFLGLDDQTTQIQLTSGSLSVHVRYLDSSQVFEVDTPNSAFSIFGPGDYRIDVPPNSQTTFVTVRGGNGEVTGGGQAFSIASGEQAAVTGDRSVYYDVYGAPDPDAWDGWCMDREMREERSASLRYVPPEMTGYVDLDDHGYWQNSPYGQVWVPRDVQPGWAPYHYGHWSWIDPWGWTWVDDAPWGFAPFHYGRWAYWNDRWAWVPGPLAARPVYAPALVAWVGGPHFGVSLSFGSAAIAWVPLGPREVYVPPYQVSSAYVTRVNTSNTVIANFDVTNVYNITHVTYVNSRAPNAVVAMPAQAMASARPVHEVAKPVSAAEFSSAQVVRAAQVAPQRQAVLGHANAPANVPHPPAALANRAVVAKHAPPPPPVSFAQKQQALQKNPGVPLSHEQVQQIRQSSPPPARAMVVKQAPAAHVVKPTVSKQPPQRAMQAIQARPGAKPLAAPLPPTTAPNKEEKKTPPPAAVEKTTRPARTTEPRAEEKKAPPPAATEKKATRPARTTESHVEEKKAPPPAATEKKTTRPAGTTEPRVEEKKAPPPAATEKPHVTAKPAATKKTTKPPKETEKKE